MSDAMNRDRVLTLMREADRMLMAGECLGARKADLVLSWLCPLLWAEGKRLVVTKADLKEYSDLAKDEGADEGARIFARRCLNRLRNLQEAGCIAVMEDPFSGAEKGKALPVLAVDRDHPPLWAEGKGPLIMIVTEEDGDVEILPAGSSGAGRKTGSRILPLVREGMRKIRKNGLDWLLGNDF